MTGGGTKDNKGVILKKEIPKYGGPGLLSGKFGISVQKLTA